MSWFSDWRVSTWTSFAAFYLNRYYFGGNSTRKTWVSFFVKLGRMARDLVPCTMLYFSHLFIKLRVRTKCFQKRYCMCLLRSFLNEGLFLASVCVCEEYEYGSWQPHENKGVFTRPNTETDKNGFSRIVFFFLSVHIAQRQIPTQTALGSVTIFVSALVTEYSLFGGYALIHITDM